MMTSQRKIRKAIFPVAGLGTRFLPATKSIPKEMLPIVDKPLIQYAVEEALEAGIDTLIFVTSRKKHAISDHFDTAFELESRLAEQGKTTLLKRITEIIPDHVARVHVTQMAAKGLGHAVLCAETAVGNEPFAVILADDMIRCSGPGCMARMVEAHGDTGASMLGVEAIPMEMTSQYGVVGVSDSGSMQNRIKTIVEKPAPEDAPSNLGVVGRYVLIPEIFDYLRELGSGAGGEIQLTDGIASMLNQHPVLAWPIVGDRYDCGSRAGFIRATMDYAMEHEDLREPLLEHMKACLGRA
jgi:UTP--glucose-1-phosphate uridylyltransferase